LNESDNIESKCEKRLNESDNIESNIESFLVVRAADIRNAQLTLKGLEILDLFLLTTTAADDVNIMKDTCDSSEDESEEELRQRIAAIKHNLPKSGEYLKVEKLFKVEGKLDKFFTSLEQEKKSSAYIKEWLKNTESLKEPEKQKFIKAMNERRNTSNNDAKITNYVGSKGARWMKDSTFLMDSKYEYLAPMKLILEFIEGLSWTDEDNVERSYVLQYNYIYNKEASVAQKAHTDYKKSDGLNDKHKALPFTIFLGTRENSKLIIWNRRFKRYETVEYGVGDVLFLAGDVIHAGPTYLKAHGRMQLYADTNVRHDALNPNEWLQMPFSEQPLAYELDEGIYNAAYFQEAICHTALLTTYGVKKEDIVEILKKNEVNPNEKEKFFFLNENSLLNKV
jgi:hypothetical protein